MMNPSIGKYPPDPGPWTSEQQKEFNLNVIETLKTAIEELWPDYQVIDEFSHRLELGMVVGSPLDPRLELCRLRA